MKEQRGFTVIEVLIVLGIVLVGAFIFFTQKAEIDASSRDQERKTAINAMYYSLEEVFYKENGYYPESLSEDTLRAVDPELLTDPEGNALDSPLSNYVYDSQDCSLGGECQSYRLHSNMEREDTYEKTSRAND